MAKKITVAMLNSGIDGFDQDFIMGVFETLEERIEKIKKIKDVKDLISPLDPEQDKEDEELIKFLGCWMAFICKAACTPAAYKKFMGELKNELSKIEE